MQNEFEAIVNNLKESIVITSKKQPNTSTDEQAENEGAASKENKIEYANDVFLNYFHDFINKNNG